MSRIRLATSAAALAIFLGSHSMPAVAGGPQVTCGVAGDPYVPGVNCRTVVVNGYNREYYVYVPPVLNRRDSGVPIVLGYHGSGGSGLGFLANSGLLEKADEKGFIGVFQSALTYWERKSGGPETLFNTWADDAQASED